MGHSLCCNTMYNTVSSDSELNCGLYRLLVSTHRNVHVIFSARAHCIVTKSFDRAVLVARCVLYRLCRQSKRLQITCPRHELMGGKEIHSGWDVCTAEPFNLVKPCLVYSIG